MSTTATKIFIVADEEPVLLFPIDPFGLVPKASRFGHQKNVHSFIASQLCQPATFGSRLTELGMFGNTLDLVAKRFTTQTS